MADSRRKLLGKPLNPLRYKRLDETDIHGTITPLVEAPVGCVPANGVVDLTDGDCWRWWKTATSGTPYDPTILPTSFALEIGESRSSTDPSRSSIVEIANYRDEAGNLFYLGPPCQPRPCQGNDACLSFDWSFNGSVTPTGDVGTAYLTWHIEAAVGKILPDPLHDPDSSFQISGRTCGSAHMLCAEDEESPMSRSGSEQLCTLNVLDDWYGVASLKLTANMAVTSQFGGAASASFEGTLMISNLAWSLI